MKNFVNVCVCVCAPNLFEGVQHFLSLAEVSEEQLQSSRHQRGVVVHGEVDQNPQEHTATFVIHLQDAVPLPARRQTHTHLSPHLFLLEPDCL